MKHGLCVPNGGVCGDARVLGELAARAEEAGWDGIFLEDYIIWQGHNNVPTCDSWVALAAMAMITRRIRLGTMVTPIPRRRPWKLAREAATVDHLSGGRVILGAGSGETSIDTSYTGFGEVTDAKERASMLDEALEVIRACWSGRQFSYEGKHFHLNKVRFLPRPVQRPRIPIWIGGGWPLKGPARRAARWDGACMYRQAGGDMTPVEVRELKERIGEMRTADGPYDIALGGRRRGKDWGKEREYIASIAEAGATWWIEYLPPQLGGLDRVRAAIEQGPLQID
jgi:alkanesulfonate monooxygenase SsuD/methylene tetrahydromethanopterin reductase-like flavin-dependent oxidoreductase (luciferase family)